eukprot:scaffold130700_cov68-Attheya_sp.AAC.2
MADYWTEHHPNCHHRAMHTKILHPIPHDISNAQDTCTTSRSQRGCVVTGRESGIRKPFPLPPYRFPVSGNGTLAAEDEATAKLVQERAAIAAVLLVDAEVTKATNIAALAEDEAAASKLVQERAAAGLADVDVTKAANIAALAKAAEYQAAAKLVQEKAAASSGLADAAEVTKAANVAVLAKAAEDEAAAKLVLQEKAAAAAGLADAAEVANAANIAVLAKAAEDEAAAKLVQEKAAAAATIATYFVDLAALAATKNEANVLAAAAEETTKALAANVAKKVAEAEAAAKDDATTKLVQKLLDEDLLRKESPVKSPTNKSTSALKNLESGYIESKKQTSSSTSKKLLNKESIKKTPLLPKRLQAIVNGKDITVFVKMIKKPVMHQGYRDVVKGSPYFKEHRRGAPPEPVGSNILQNNKKDKAIGCTTGIVLVGSALSDASLTHYMKSIFDVITVEPEKVIKMSEKELERILHKLGRSSMNAGNILAMTKNVLDEHNAGQVPADWDAIIKFHGVGQKIASVVDYEAFGISCIPVDVHVLRFAKYFGWFWESASAFECQEDIEGWMPEINWYRVNSTIGSFCQLATRNQSLLYSEMDRMRMGLINPKFDMLYFLQKYVSLWEHSGTKR